MDYLIYDQSNELIDILNFKTSKEYDAYKIKNPKHILIKAEDNIFENEIYDEDFE